MSGRDSVGLIVGLLLLGAVLFFSLTGTRTETSVFSPTLNAEDLEFDDALITGKSQSGGTSIFGMHFGKTTYYAHVLLIAGPGCFELAETGNPWPAPIEECSSPVAITGEISGGGVATTGDSLIEVVVEVDASCYAEVVGGELWPPKEADCTVGE